MIKNFTRIRQWAGEKLGSSRGTLPNEEFKDFQLETKLRHEDFDEMRHTICAAIKHIPLKKSTHDGKHRRSLIGDFGESLVTHASMFPSDSVYWKMLMALGRGERQLSESEGDFADAAKDNYMALLFEYDQHYKEYQSLCRKLESRRLDYDAKYNQLRKAKKERLGNEQSVQAAKVKYEETELDVVQSMIYLQETEVDHCDGLHSLLDSQLDFHRKAFDILQQVKTEWDNWIENCSKTGFSPISTTPNQFSTCDGKSHGDDRTKPILRRALHEHIQDLDDELTFHINDIITVLHKVDDGWWLGELKDKNNQVYRGIFPVNYTEPYTDDSNDNNDNDNNGARADDYGAKNGSNITGTSKYNNEIEKDKSMTTPKILNQHTKNTSDQTDHTENNKCEHTENSSMDIGHATSRRDEKTPPQHIDTQNVQSIVAPSTSETPSSSFVSPSISSPLLANDNPAHPHSKRSSLSLSTTSSLLSAAATAAPTTISASLLQEQQHDRDDTSLTSITPDHQKPPAARRPSTSPSENYDRPLPPIPLDD